MKLEESSLWTELMKFSFHMGCGKQLPSAYVCSERGGGGGLRLATWATFAFGWENLMVTAHE